MPDNESANQQFNPPQALAQGQIASSPSDLPTPVQVVGPVAVQISPVASAGRPSDQRALWIAIRNRTAAMSFSRYQDFIDTILCKAQEPISTRTQESCGGQQPLKPLVDRLGILPKPLHGVDAYHLLKSATEIFLLRECGIVINEYQPSSQSSPLVPGLSDTIGNEPLGLQEVRNLLSTYLSNKPLFSNVLNALGDKLVDSPFCFGLLRSRFQCPCMLELIWSYWHEEGMLVQTINAIALRFQNRRSSAEKDPLASMEIGYLRPLNNLLWGYIQDESSRLSVARRAYEYDHHYGLTLQGKAVPPLRSADSRSKFLAAFHNLLRRTSEFYKQVANLMVVPDTFPLLQSLKETNLLLAEGMHNQYGDLPWTARVEMLMQQWFLSRPEVREFLHGREMVSYPEPWMGQVDAMKTLQGWTDSNVRHFRDLAVYGEQILLSVRFGDWASSPDPNDARAWAETWRLQIQGYIDSYRAVTGVDLTYHPTDQKPVDSTPPWVYLKDRARSVTGS